MISKVIYFVESKFNERDFNRFGIKTLEENGFDVEVWEFTPFLHAEHYETIQVPDPIYYKKHHVFPASDTAAKAILSLNNHVFVICLIPYNFNTFTIYRTLSKRTIPYCLFSANALPTPSLNRNRNYYLNKIRRITIPKLISRSFDYFKKYGIGVRGANILLAGGEKSVNHGDPLIRNAEILWIHALDYDLYLKESKNPVQIKPKIGVFLDEYLPFHSDYFYAKESPSNKPEKYYPLLCCFFELIEKKYNMKIVIAAHPRSFYERQPDYFDGRPVIRGNTAELVRKSEFVMVHSSTAINFAILFKKPILFITTKHYEVSTEGPLLSAMARLLGKEAIHIDQKPLLFNMEKKLTIDEEAYKNYKQCYIKKEGTEELFFWQVLANRLKKWERQ